MAIGSPLLILVLSAFQTYCLRLFLAEQKAALPLLWALIFCANTVLVLIYRWFIYPTFLSSLRDLPQPPISSFLLGHTKARFEVPRGKSILQWVDTLPNDGLIRLRDRVNMDVVVVTSHETLKSVLSDNSYDFPKGSGLRDVLRLALGDGIILAEGSQHKFQRKHLQPSFNVKVIRDLYPLFWAKSLELVNRLKPVAQAGEVFLHPWCSRVTFDIIGVAALGKDFGVVENPENEVMRQYRSLSAFSGQRRLWFILHFLLPHRVINSIPFWRVPEDIERRSANLQRFALNVSKGRRATLDASQSGKTDKSDFKDLLSNLVRSNDFTDHELAQQVLTMMTAGHETTSSALSFVTFLLGKHQDIQARLRDEIRAALPSPDSQGAVDAAEMEHLPLLNAVCNETLRLFPTVTFTARVAKSQTTLGNHVIPAGTVIYISPWAINRAQKFWGEDAQEFRPDRWITNGLFNNNGGADSNYSMITFLHGPRSCIGQGFARAELRCLVAAVVGRYQLDLAQPVEEYEPRGMVSIKPKNDTPLRMTEIPGW